MCGRSCYEISTMLLREVYGGSCIFKIAEMLIFKGALKHTFLHLKKDTNKKTASNNRATLHSLYFDFSLCEL